MGDVDFSKDSMAVIGQAELISNVLVPSRSDSQDTAHRVEDHFQHRFRAETCPYDVRDGLRQPPLAFSGTSRCVA